MNYERRHLFASLLIMVMLQATFVKCKIRCRFKVSLINEGVFTARFRASYKDYSHPEDGRQPTFVSSTAVLLGDAISHLLPYFSTDLVVYLEGFNGFTWYQIKKDTDIDTDQICFKCYKVWNTVTDPHWDYVDC